MELHKDLIQDSKGFTLVEILIAIALLIVILSLGLFISFDFYKNYAFRSEKNIIVSILQKARNQSLNNINQTTHRVHFERDGSNPQRVISYTIFEGGSYVSGAAGNIVTEASYGVFITTPTLPFDIMFNQLNGDSADATITVSDGVKSYNITVNSEGRIDW